MMNIKSWLIIGVFLLWGFFCWQWYTCGIKGFCIFNSIRSDEETNEFYDPPFTFKKSSFVCIKGKGLQNYIDSLKKLISEEKKVTITGLYDSSEINKSKFINLGLARASRIKCLLASHLDTSKILIQSKLFGSAIPTEPFIAHLTDVEINETDDILTEITESAQLTEAEEPKKKQISVEKPASTENNTNLEKEYSITFGPNSIKKDASTETDNYLNALAEQLKSNGKKLMITGHTDITENKKLDRIRAWVIKSELLERGVNSTQLITSGKNSTEPVGDNNTVEGRHKNRRVVIK